MNIIQDKMLVLSIALFIYAALNVSAGSSSLTGELRGVTRRLETDEELDICDQDYSKRTLKEIKTVPFMELYGMHSSLTAYEGSDIVLGEGGHLYAVCDNTWNIFRADVTLVNDDLKNEDQRLNKIWKIGREKKGEKADFEGLIYNRTDNNYLVIREAVKSIPGNYFGYTVEFTLDPDAKTWTPGEECQMDHLFTAANKGFEGGLHFYSKNNLQRFLLAICEGNHCDSGGNAKDPGHGIIKMFKKTVDDDNFCQWEFYKDVYVPSDANFLDYSSLTMYKDRVAILSQRSSAVYFGELEGVGESKPGSGVWVINNAAKLKFKKDKGQTLYFPRDYKCEIKFCSLEGIAFLNDHMLLAVSDDTKHNDKYTCREKDESLHIFALPAIKRA